MLGRLVVFALAMGCVAAASAQPAVNLTRPSGPNTYFNRPGADVTTHDRELSECIVLAQRTFEPPTYGGASLLSAFVAAALDTWEDYKMHGANAENCMVARGWRVVEIPADEADQIARLPQPDQAARLRDWVGAATPHGMIVRQWANDADIGPTHKFGRTPLLGGRPGLSFSARNQSIDPKPTPDPNDGWGQYSGLAREVKPNDLGSVPPGDAVIVFWVKAAGTSNGDTVILRRMGADGDRAPRLVDKAPDQIMAYDNPIWQGGGRWMAFRAPPGRWRIAALGAATDMFELNFCLGGPSFEAHAGDVIFAGAFNLGAADAGPDMNLEPARAWLGHTPAADRLAPAVYANGARGACGGQFIYALEVKGAPYAPGYVWGGAPGRAAAPSAAPAPPPAPSSASASTGPAPSP